MKFIGAIVLSFEEVGDLSGIVPWKIERPQDLFARLHEAGLPMSGFLYLSTCNRVEIIYTLNSSGRHDDVLAEIMKHQPKLRDGLIPAHYKGRKAVRHLLRLASGLESMVLGETEIRAQIKEAFESSGTKKMADLRLRLLFQNIFQESRLIRSSISMSNLPLSVATLAIQSLEKHDSFHPGTHPVIIGSGPMSRQAALYLAKREQKSILVNRTLSKIESTARKLQLKTLEFESFMQQPGQSGAISSLITATSRNDSFIDAAFLQRLQASNRSHGFDGNIVLVDMALPPDVDPSVSSMPGIELISIETLRKELEDNRQRRVRAAEEAEEMIEDSLFRVEVNLVTGLSGTIMHMIQKRVKDRSRHHLNNLLDHRLSHLNPKDRRMIYSWAIHANRDLNKIHRRGLECILRHYYTENRLEKTIFGEH